MKIAGGILLGMGLLLVAVAFASTVFGIFGTFNRIAASPGMPAPGEVADQVADVVAVSLVLTAFGMLSVLTGGVLLLVGLLRKPAPQTSVAGAPPGAA